MLVNDELLDKLSELARLEIDPAEREGLKNDLQKMISFVEKLQEVNTDDVEPQLQMNREINIFKEDEKVENLPVEEALRNAPETDGKYFKVPKVIRKE